MKQSLRLSISVSVVMILILSGCQRYYDWLACDVFNQGTEMKRFTQVPQQYVRSAHVYDQLATIGLFNAMWLHDEVRTAYAKLHACQNCFSNEQYQSFLRRQLEENKYFISFYLLAGIPGYNKYLTDKDPQWTIKLRVNGVCYNSVEIKKIELPHEYVIFFGKGYSIFKDHYLLKFDAVDIDGNPLIHSGVDRVELVLFRVGKKEVMTWCLDQTVRVIRTDMYNPDYLFYDLDENF